jgi:16S rRNA G966 N2-methylase RsmD
MNNTTSPLSSQVNTLSFPDSFFRFIASHEAENPAELRLRYHGKPADFDVDLAITQIECRRKTAKKLRRFNSSQRVLFPSVVAAEQSSHESVASFHASLISPGSRIADMTAGLGIDVMAMAANAASVTAFELDPLKAACLTHNCHELGFVNIDVVNGDSVIGVLGGEEASKNIGDNSKKYDYIFIDPARRGEFNSRVYNFHDCQPDIIRLHTELLSHCSTLIIKASPLLDISQTIKDISCIRRIYAVSVNGECKEILIVAAAPLSSDEGEGIEMWAVDLSNEGELISSFSATPNPADSRTEIRYALPADIVPGSYLYEPNASVMKLAPWSALASAYPDLRKLGASSHLYVSRELHHDFPGRILRLDGEIDAKMRKALKGGRFNVVSRNYPLPAEGLRKKLGVKEGADSFIYGTRLGNTPLLLQATRLRNVTNPDIVS